MFYKLIDISISLIEDNSSRVAIYNLKNFLNKTIPPPTRHCNFFKTGLAVLRYLTPRRETMLISASTNQLLTRTKGNKKKHELGIFIFHFYVRERARRRNCELDRGELSVVRLSPVKSKPRAVSLVRSPRAPPILELDTVLEERSDPEQTTLSQVEITPDREVGAILFGAVGAVGTAAAATMCARDS
ncbi:uncharacterized protein LOC115441868 isoform X1 [Manduca sexta]|uniref:uncharacterized protein LOC115441868 isoform X1 n=1 Tax=Manduca sexta TaxID=7130 RepID=UPI00188F5F25|nr:uncharacterized protein LOC115441868 isoform X1 [Manduca sexta]